MQNKITLAPECAQKLQENRDKERLEQLVKEDSFALTMSPEDVSMILAIIDGSNGWRRQIKLGRKLYEFRSFDIWKQKALSLFQRSGRQSRELVYLDQCGRILLDGGDFMQADKDNTFPVEVFLARPEQ